ncbi:MAG: hypothetical protein R2705_13605 [Ilumatobacteraceae bacterium]
MGLVDRGRLPKPLTQLFNMGRSYSMWVYQWGLACCSHHRDGRRAWFPCYDVMRLGGSRCPPACARRTWWSSRAPTQDGLAIGRGCVEQMPEPKYVI